MTADIVIVGAGAAGIAAARTIAAAGRRVLVLEARTRVGGRAHSIPLGGHRQDLGAGWLHSAERNPLVPMVAAQGLGLDRSPPPWMQQLPGTGLDADDQAALGQARALFDERVSGYAGPDRPLSDMLPDGWPAALLDAISTWYSGDRMGRISLLDYQHYEAAATGTDWRVSEGYGTLLERLAAPLPIRLDCPVRRIVRTSAGVRIETPHGALEPSAAIITVPSAVLAAGAIRFDPALDDWLTAAASLPLGAVDKILLALDRPDLPRDSHAFGNLHEDDPISFHIKPFGRPLLEAWVGGDVARTLSSAGPQAAAAFAIDSAVALLGSAMRSRLRLLAASQWVNDPWSRGSYSYARPGESEARARLASPAERILFAGEATSRDDFSTAHGAWDTGVTAARRALDLLPG